MLEQLTNLTFILMSFFMASMMYLAGVHSAIHVALRCNLQSESRCMHDGKALYSLLNVDILP